MDILGFVTELAVMQAELEHGHKVALDKAGALLETEAKAVLGSYEYGWPSLTPETIARKATGDSPLLETGELRDSIAHKVVDDKTCDMGSNNDKAVWHELGTTTIPPRSFLAETAIRHEGEVHAILEADFKHCLKLT